MSANEINTTTAARLNEQATRIKAHYDRTDGRPIGAKKKLDRINASVRVACTAGDEKDRRAAFRLRYEVYIAEQGKPYPEADHEKRYLSDELDADGDIIVVESGDVIVGTVRANCFSSALTQARYARVVQLDRFSAIDMSEIVVCSRLAASAEHRQSVARDLLFEGIYAHRLARKTKLCFATCAPVLVRMFRKYGFREYDLPVSDPVVGRLHRTVLVLDDLDYLTRIKSPFVPIARRHAVAEMSRPWLDNIFAEYKARHVSP